MKTIEYIVDLEDVDYYLNKQFSLKQTPLNYKEKGESIEFKADFGDIAIIPESERKKLNEKEIKEIVKSRVKVILSYKENVCTSSEVEFQKKELKEKYKLY